MRAIALSSLLLAACGGGEPAGDGADSAEPLVWPPPAPERGLQLVLDDVALDIGEEVERCRPVQTSGVDGGIVDRIELFSKEGLHHVFVTKGGADLLEGEEPCFGFPDAAMEGYSVPEPLYASSTQVEHERVDFPEGVGVRLDDDPGFILNYHLINYVGEPLTSEAYLNLHYAEEPEGMEEAGLYVMGNMSDWTVPAGGTGEIRFTCPFDEDVEVFSLTPHQHQLATGFKVEDTQTGEVLMETGEWDAPSSTYFDPPLEFQEGEAMTVTCTWANPGDQDVQFGSSADDEMCFLFGYHWPTSGFRFLSEYTGCSVERG